MLLAQVCLPFVGTVFLKRLVLGIPGIVGYVSNVMIGFQEAVLIARIRVWQAWLSKRRLAY